MHFLFDCKIYCTTIRDLPVMLKIFTYYAMLHAQKFSLLNTPHALLKICTLMGK